MTAVSRNAHLLDSHSRWNAGIVGVVAGRYHGFEMNSESVSNFCMSNDIMLTAKQQQLRWSVTVSDCQYSQMTSFDDALTRAELCVFSTILSSEIF